MSNKKLLILICILAIALSLALNGLCYEFFPFDRDTVSYLFQAKLFAQGRLFANSPPEYGFSPSEYINIHNGKWYSRYPFGNALMLTLGVLVGAPALIPAILTGLALFLLYLIVKEAYGKRIAMLAAGLGFISPATFGIGSTFYGENVSRFFLAVYLFALIKTLKGGRWFYPALSGFALGYAFNTRPPTAAAFGIAGAGFVLHWFMGNKDRKSFFRKILFFSIPFVAMLGLYTAWNTYFTGSPFKSTFTACRPYDKLGFGKYVVGYYNLNRALDRTLRQVLPCISFNTFGWGYYHPSQFLNNTNVSTGIMVNSPLIRNLVALELIGFGNGEGQIQIRSIDKKFQSRPLDLSNSRGLAEVSLRLVKEADKYTGYFMTLKSRDWVKFEPLTIKLQTPLEVGIHLDTGSFVDNDFRMNYDFFHVNSDSGTELVSSDFLGTHLSRFWHCNLKSNQWKFTKAGWLTIWGNVRNNIMTDKNLYKFYQIVNSDKFDIETHFVANWRRNNFLFLLRAIPLAFPFILMLIPLFHSSRNRYDILFLSFFLLNLLFYFFYWFDTSAVDNVPFASRYYGESTLLGIIPLIAKGMSIFYKTIKRLPSKFPSIILIILIVFLSVNTVYSYVFIAGDCRQCRNNTYRDLPKLVAKKGIHSAVIFLPYGSLSPLCDYPFRSLKDADIIYFNFYGTSRLTNADLRRVYKQYFEGRRPYLYRYGELTPISETDILSENSEIIR